MFIEGGMHAQLLQSCPTFCDPLDCSLPGSTVYGLLQAIILEWFAMHSSKGSSLPRDQAHISCGLLLCKWILYCWATGEACWRVTGFLSLKEKGSVGLCHWELPGWNLKLAAIHREQGETKEIGKPIQIGRWQVYRQRRVVLGGHELNRSPHSPARILVYTKALTGLSHALSLVGLNDTTLSSLPPWKTPTVGVYGSGGQRGHSKTVCFSGIDWDHPRKAEPKLESWVSSWRS